MGTLAAVGSGLPRPRGGRGGAARALTPQEAYAERQWLDMAPGEVVARSEEALREALEDWQRVSGGGGDAIRRVLGTVGTVSPVYAIRKAMRQLLEREPDLVEQVELVGEKLQLADYLAYSSVFAATSGCGVEKATQANQGSCAKEYVIQTKAEVEALLRAVVALRRDANTAGVL